ncbi:uncharacterized protein LOC143235751 [Tachypleus tridentatus]|uniref:uncharacterized protein LOC143235751 n=1 Tax=Tachypleus tridentatus TaxID=6853 RepID=UPI003FD2D1B9
MSSRCQTGSVAETASSEAASLKTSSGKERDQVNTSKRKVLQTLSRKGTRSLQDLVTCSICLDRLYIPKMLSCQHTFCLLCIQNCVVGSGDAAKIRCAQCRSENPLPKEGVSVLPGNIYLQSILDLLQTDCTTVNDFAQCSNCRTICDVNVCEHCNNSFCPTCQERHLDELKKQLNKIADQLKMMIDKVEKRAEYFQDYCMTLKEEIKEEAAKRVKKVVDAETHLLQNVDQIMSNENVIWKESVKKPGYNSSTDTRLHELDFMGISGNNGFYKFPFLTHLMVTTFLRLHHESSDLMSDSCLSFHNKLLFDPQSFTLNTRIKEFSTEGHEESGTGSVALHPAPSGEEARNENCNPKPREWIEAHARLYRLKSFAPKVKLGTNQLQRPSGVALSPWSNEVFVVSMDNHRVAIFDINSGKYLRFFGSRGHKPGEFLCPFGIALSQTEQTILVTDKWKHCIHVFRKDGKFQKQIGMKGRSSGHFRSPESITVDKYGRIYVCDTCNDRIQVFDKEGAFIRAVGVRSLTEGDSVRQHSIFHQPTGIDVTPDGQRMVVSDFGNHRIHVFSFDGDLLVTFGQKGTQRGQFIHPECVAVDNKGFIFVGDSGNGRVQICLPDGRFIRSFGSKGCHSGQFSWISGIAVTDRYDIIVTDFKNHCVQIF